VASRIRCRVAGVCQPTRYRRGYAALVHQSRRLSDVVRASAIAVLTRTSPAPAEPISVSAEVQLGGIYPLTGYSGHGSGYSLGGRGAAFPEELPPNLGLLGSFTYYASSDPLIRGNRTSWYVGSAGARRLIPIANDFLISLDGLLGMEFYSGGTFLKGVVVSAAVGLRYTTHHVFIALDANPELTAGRYETDGSRFDPRGLMLKADAVAGTAW